MRIYRDCKYRVNVRIFVVSINVVFLEDSELVSDYDDATSCRYIRVRYLNDKVGFISSADFLERALLED